MDWLLERLAARSGCLIPVALALSLVAGILAVRTGRPVARADLAAPGRADPAIASFPDPSSAALKATPASPAGPIGPFAAGTTAPAGVAVPSPTAFPIRVRATATPDPRQWRGRALTDVIIREEPTTEARPAGLLLKEEGAVVEAIVPGEEVEKGNNQWYWVRSGVMEGFVYSSLFEAGPRPAG